ncbi:hypothetical protein D9C01_13175 [Corynebacterium diphtheriae]|nr:hypothetical protein D9C01_13175 [Corynebacterium diphtheriae]
MRVAFSGALGCSVVVDRGDVAAPDGQAGSEVLDARTMVEGIVYRYRTGIAWLEHHRFQRYGLGRV